MDLKDVYTEMIIEHSRNKRNNRELENPTFKELGHNPSCGDEITLEVKVEGEKIKDIAYLGHGCAISLASTSIMCDTVKGLEVKKVLELCNKFISMIKSEISDEDELEELDDAIIFQNISNMPARVKCAVLAWYTLKESLEEKVLGEGQ